MILIPIAIGTRLTIVTLISVQPKTQKIMPHIDGHVITDPSSCGILQLTGECAPKLFFLPNWKIEWNSEEEKKKEIGFHPIGMKGMGFDSVFAINVYKLKDYEIMEKIFKNHCHCPGEVELLWNTPTELEKIKNLIKSPKDISGFSHEDSELYKEMLQKTLDYFKTPDFKKYYFALSSGSIKTSSTSTPSIASPSATHARENIIAKMK